MARYEEKIFKWFPCFIVIAFAFLLLYCPFQLGDRELYWQEGYYAVQAAEMEYLLPMTFAHGVVIKNSYPLFPWIASLLNNELGWSLEFSLRFISVFSLALLTSVVWYAARSAGGVQAAAVAAAMMISSNIVIEKALDGYPDMLMLFFLTVGWLLWFSFGAGQGNWSVAWIFALFFCGLVFYTNGPLAVLYFVIPLILMRRPLTIWPKLRKPGFFIGLAIFLGFLLLWKMPHLIFARTLPFRYMPMEAKHFYAYLEHLIVFPFDVVVRFFPWSLLAWAPFCVALHPLDRTPIFSRFLRTIFFALFFLLWLSPYSEPRDIMLLAPPLAIMTGLNYWLVIRRYGNFMMKILNFFPWMAMGIGLVIFVFYLAPANWWTNLVSLSRGIEFKYVAFNFICGMIGASLAVAAGFTLIVLRRKPPIWFYMLVLIICPVIFFWTIARPYKAQENSKQTLGMELRAALNKEHVPMNEIIYKSAILGLYGECYYMGGKVQKIFSLDELPKDKKVVYLLSPEFPEFPERRWRNLRPTRQQYRKKRLCLWQGVKIDNKRRFRKWSR
jgi:hypothetical protein